MSPPATPEKRNLAFPMIGLVMLLVGLGFGGAQVAFLLGAETAEGEVVEIVSRRPAGASASMAVST